MTYFIEKNTSNNVYLNRYLAIVQNNNKVIDFDKPYHKNLNSPIFTIKKTQQDFHHLDFKEKLKIFKKMEVQCSDNNFKNKNQFCKLGVDSAFKNKLNQINTEKIKFFDQEKYYNLYSINKHVKKN